MAVAFWRRLALRLRNFFRPGPAEVDLARELSAHIDLIEEDLRHRGLTDEQARLAARRSFAGIEQVKERQRDERSFRWLEDLRWDVRYAVRSLKKAPGFTAIAILTIAVGIGANTAIFSLVHSVLLDPLPFKNPDRLVRPYENVPAGLAPNGKPARMGGMDVREILELQAHARTLSHVIVQGMALVSIAGGTDVVQRELTSVSAATFPMLGVPPLIGRWFTAEDERADDHDIILSYAAWQRYFSGDPHALGKTLKFNGNTFTQGVALGDAYIVVGVMPPGFAFPDDDTQFWIPRSLTLPTDGRPRRVTMMARLADGASLESAAAEVSAIVRDVRGRDRGTLAGASTSPSFEFVRVQDEVGAPVKPALLVLSVAVAFVLLIACANVANLLLARTAARSREIAVRVAIGAGRGRLIRQLLTESVLLSLAGGAAGILLAAAGVRLFRALATDLGRLDLGSLGGAFPRLAAIGLDGPVLAFSIAISIVTGLLFGLAPALHLARGAQMDVLRAAAGTTSTGAARVSVRGRPSARGLLVIAEVGLATLLCISAGLLIHSFAKLANIDPGYNPANVLTFQVSLPGAQRPSANRRTFAEDLVARLQLIPGVQAAGYANQLPMVALENSMPLRTRPDPALLIPSADAPDVRLVSRDFLKTMGIRVVAGRAFGEGDGPGQPRVMLMNRTLARRDFGDKSPVGMTVYTGRDVVPWEVVGVVDDVRQRGLDREPRPQIFVNMPQWPGPGVPVFPAGAYYAVRTSVDPTSVIGHVHGIVMQVEPQASLENVATMEQIVSNGMTRPRMYAVLLGIFAAVAVALGAAGIYGVMAYAVTERTRELGIRMALGAQRAAVLGIVLRQSTSLTAAGMALGLAAAVAATRYLEAFLFGLTPLDPATFAAVAVLFASVAAIAAMVPARRATRVDPLIALRHE